MAAAMAAASSSESFSSAGAGSIAALSVSWGSSALDMAGECRVVGLVWFFVLIPIKGTRTFVVPGAGMTKPFAVGRLCNLQRKGSESRPFKVELTEPRSLCSFLCKGGGTLNFRHI
jgi:hypothetical protein